MIAHAGYTFFMKLVRNVPYFAQEKDYACGPACIRAVLASFGIYETEQKIRNRMRSGPLFGTRHHQFGRICKDLGLFSNTRTNATLHTIERALASNRCVIVNFLNDEGTSHYAVVNKLTESHIILNDPWKGEKQTLLRKDFEEKWNTVNRFGKGNWYNAWMIEISDEPF